LDYTEQNYVANNPFTYNYMGSANRINQQKLLQGNWRGLYRYFYDTETPNTTPWQMVGFSVKCPHGGSNAMVQRLIPQATVFYGTTSKLVS
jgi:hypothetical protein